MQWNDADQAWRTHFDEFRAEQSAKYIWVNVVSSVNRQFNCHSRGVIDFGGSKNLGEIVHYCVR